VGQQPRTEILAGGREESLPAAVSLWLRGNRRLAAALTVVALVAAGTVVLRSTRDPGPPTLAVEGIAGSSPVADPWQSGCSCGVRCSTSLGTWQRPIGRPSAIRWLCRNRTATHFQATSCQAARTLVIGVEDISHASGVVAASSLTLVHVVAPGMLLRP